VQERAGGRVARAVRASGGGAICRLGSCFPRYFLAFNSTLRLHKIAIG
jgi:hypothetical protein